MQVVVSEVATMWPHPDIPRLYHLVECPYLRGHAVQALWERLWKTLLAAQVSSLAQAAVVTLL